MRIDPMDTPLSFTTQEHSPVVYPGAMPDNLDPIRQELRDLAAEFEKARALVDKRFELVEKARAAGMTWNEAAIILNLTQNGLIKAQKDGESRRAASQRD
jgi:hypothetical protein